MPITWRNVNAPRNDGVSRMLQNAQRSFEDSAASFGGVMEDRREIESDNRDNQIRNNTNQFRDFVRGFDSPEALAQAQQSGAIDEERARYGPLLDQEATRGLGDERLTSLRQADTAEHNYDMALREREEAPLRNDALELAQTGNYDQAIDQASNLSNSADVIAEIRGLQQQQTEFERGGELHDATMDGHERDAITFDQQQQAHAREQERIAHQETAEATTRDMFVQERNNREQNHEALGQLAQDHGLDYNNGRIDTSDLGREELVQLGRDMDAMGIDPSMSPTAAVQNHRATLMEQGIPPAIAEENAQALDALLSSNTELAQQDQETLNNRLDAVDEEFKRNKDRMEEDYERKMQDNPFLTRSNDPAGTLDQIISDLDDSGAEGWFSNMDATRARQLVRSAYPALQSGVEIQVPGTNEKEVIKPTEGMVRLALRYADSGRYNADGKFNNLIEEMMEEPEFYNQYKQSLDMQDNYRRDQDALRDGRNTEHVRVQSVFLSNRGIIAESATEFSERNQARIDRLGRESRLESQRFDSDN